MHCVQSHKLTVNLPKHLGPIWQLRRGLFEDNKLTCSFLIATALQRHAGEITAPEWSLLLRPEQNYGQPHVMPSLDLPGDWAFLTCRKSRRTRIQTSSLRRCGTMLSGCSCFSTYATRLYAIIQKRMGS